MNKRRKSLLQKLLVNDTVYKVLSPFVVAADRLRASRDNYIQQAETQKYEQAVWEIFQEEVVLNGLFKGMKYSLKSAGSSLSYSKLLGCYEAEIQPFLQAAVSKGYDEIINIGCHDGYYAVGLARLLPESTVYGFDLDPSALDLTRELAQRNGVEGQIKYGGLFTEKQLTLINEDRTTLLLVDCEGAEKEIFTASTVEHLKNSDLIIELHLHVHPELLQHFKDLFSSTHEINVVNSVDDHLKAITYNYPELVNKSYALKRYILQERPVFMQWIFLTSKRRQ